jgi:hypothetical protein
MQLTIAQAAQRLGLTGPATRSLVYSGRIRQVAGTSPIEVLAEDVDRIRRQRRAEAIRRHPDLAMFARDIRRTLWPLADAEPREVELYDGRREFVRDVPVVNRPASGRDAIRFLPFDASAVFGRDVLEAAAAPASAFTGGACRWCLADVAARVNASWRPEDTPACRELLGPQCARCRARIASEAKAARSELARLRARVEASTRTAATHRARTEYDAAQRGASGAAARLRQATEALVRVDPSSAATVASGAPGAQERRSRLDCPCTTETLCADHARRLAARGR